MLSIIELKENMQWLEKTSYWKYIGQLFNNLRVQEDTTIKNMLMVKELLGDYQPNTMDYIYDFHNPAISKIAIECIKWKNEVDEVYSLARNVERTSFNNKPSEIFVTKYRHIQHDMLKALIQSIEDDDDDSVYSTTHYKLRQIELVSTLRDSLLLSSSLSMSEKSVIFTSDKYLARQENL